MATTIFYETLRRNWRKTLYWGLGFLIYAMYPFFMMPDQAGLEAYVDAVKGLDSGLMSAVGIEDAALLSTPEGFIGYAYFGFLLLVFGVFAVLSGLDITANDEDSGIIDMFMGLPVSRSQIVLEKLLAYSTMVIIISFMGFAGLMLGQPLSTLEINISAMRLLEGSINLIPGTLLILTFTALVSTAVRRKSMAATLAGIFVIVSYLVDAIGRAAGGEVADAVRQLSIFAHYDGTTILSTGLAVGSVIALLVVSIVFAGGAVWFFERRDVAA